MLSFLYLKVNWTFLIVRFSYSLIIESTVIVYWSVRVLLSYFLPGRSDTRAAMMVSTSKIYHNSFVSCFRG